MVSNDLIQTALITRLKANAALVARITAAEVRENQWQGTNFDYPCVRVSVTLQTPLMEWEQCSWSRVTFSVFSMSELDSSKEADEIAGLVNAALHKVSFAGTGFKFLKIRSMGLASATRMSERIWRAEASFISDVYTT